MVYEDVTAAERVKEHSSFSDVKGVRAWRKK
jgi:hypothetical protein